MKKTLAIILSVFMLFAAAPVFTTAAEKECANPADGYAPYDANDVAEGNVDSLTYDQIASILLDWVDRKIAAAAEDFNTFEVDVLGQSVEIELNVTNLDGIFSYAGYLTQLGGDFASLDTSALTGLTRAGGDINFIYALFRFMADNADVLGKVFQWEEGQTFDFGKVGEYIAALPADDDIRVFYNDYLIENDIQQKFTDEIAREMGYTAGEGETLDDVINNGILDVVTGIFKDSGLLSDTAIANIKADFNLRTTDVYTLVRDFVGVLQSDNQIKIDTYYNFFLDNYIRTALKVAFGSEPTVGAAVADTAAITAEFKSVYKDTALLSELSGGTVYYRADSGSYYAFTVSGTDVTAVNELTWTDSMSVNFDPPEVSVYTKAAGAADKVIDGKNCALVKTYYPMDDVYDMYIYSPYGEQLGVETDGTAVPAEYAALMTAENEKAMDEFFAIQATQGESILQSQIITFSEIEAYAETKATEAAQAAVENMNIMGNPVTVDSVDVSLTYKGYATEDEFIMQVTAGVTAVGKCMGVTMPVDVSSAVTNPVATVVVDGLTGSDDNVLAAFDLMNFFDSDFEIDETLLDFAGKYDEYNGVIGQVNTVLYGLVNMLTTDEGFEGIDLIDGDNSNLTANMQKICNKLNGLITAAKQFMDEQGFTDFINASGVNGLFASEHGFNAEMVYNLDFSDVESLYVCAVEMALDFTDDGEAGVVNDIHTAVEGLETLDQIAVALTDYALCEAIPEIQSIIADLNAEFGTALAFNYTVTASDASAVTDNARDVIMGKLADLGLAVITFAVDDAANTLVNKAVDELNTETGLAVPHVDFEFGVTAGATWEATLGATVNRIIGLSDGILAVAGNIDSASPVFDKISAIGNAVVPFCSMFSNCSTAAYACDFGMLAGIVFDEVLDGIFDNFLALFEAYNAVDGNKNDTVAVGVPVTYALIKASDYIVDSFFPDTVQAELYTPAADVQNTFTSSASDNAIAARNMVSVNSRKTHIVPGVLDLIRESGILPSLVVPCEHINTKNEAAVAATCVAVGYTAGVFCEDCERYISGHQEIAINPSNHVGPFTDLAAVTAGCTHTGLTAGTKCTACGNAATAQTVVPVNPANHGETENVAAVDATCTDNGYTAGIRCKDCGAYISGHAEIAATGHYDDNGDGLCDVCGFNMSQPDPEPTFFEKITQFFQKIVDWFKNLFNFG